MDLRSILSTSDNGDRGRAQQAGAAGPKQPPPPPQQQQHQLPASTPTTPAQAAAPYSFRDYSHGPQASPGRPGPLPPQQQPHPMTPQEYAGQPPGPPMGQYPAVSPYQTPGPYGHHAPPPLQPVYNDPRSPGGAPMPAPSPYRQTPTSAVAGPAGGYPFPPTPMPPQPPPEATSPVQRHQHPPPGAYPPRDAYPQQQPGPPAGPHGVAPYMQQHSMPQTPPVGPQGGPNLYIHQRSHSTHSTPTPTSAQSQHQYGIPFVQGSPVATTHSLPGEFARQPSQPPTPLGPPMSAGPRQSGTGSFAQPPSPVLQRMSSSASSAHHPQPPQMHASPGPPPPPALPPRMPSTHGVYDPHAAESHRRSQSQSERDRSISVSPKTRVPSIQGGGAMAAAARKASVIIDHDPRSLQPSVASIIEVERAVTPAKRKLDDRDLRLDEMERREPRPPPGEMNGGHNVPPHRLQRASTSPLMQRKKRIRHRDPPIFALEHGDSRRPGRSENFVLQEHRPPSINGKHEPSAAAATAAAAAVATVTVQHDHLSRHTSPETTRSVTLPAPSVQEPPRPETLLGPWEPTITGVKPFEEVSRRVADWLFLNVVNNPSSGEIHSRGIEFEVEAKLGTLIDKDTNGRVDRYVDSECLLQTTGRTAFRSSMTEAQHRGLNDFLNSVVVDTDPRNPRTMGSRVQVHYKRRREVDKYYELPPHLQDRLPACVRSLIPPKHSVKARVTYDQKTNEVLAKIVKARVSDIDLHMPHCSLDCRISVNLEMRWEGSVEELEDLATHVGERSSPDRKKDRLSYTQSHYQIDLTQVIQAIPIPGKEPRLEKEHELEIELSAAALIEQGRRAANNEPHQYPDLVEGLIDNVRLIARRAG